MMEYPSSDTHYVIDYTFIDDDRCVSPLRISVEGPGGVPYEHFSLDKLESTLGDMFRKAGWEGDGEIGCLLIAPCFSGREDGFFDVVYHVKQGNNGISWLAIPNGLTLSVPKGQLYPAK